MKPKLPSAPEGQKLPVSNSGFSLTRANFLRLSLVGVMITALILSLLLNIKQAQDQKTSQLGVAPVTATPSLDFSAIAGTLPDDKVQAQKLVKQYYSNFNFDQVRSLNRNIGAVPPWANQTGNQAALNNAATPQPTPTQSFTPNPSGGINIFTGVAAPDPFEFPSRDDTVANAKPIGVAAVQNRTFDTPADIDWIVFILNSGGGIPHSIIITSSILTGTDLVDPAVELYDNRFQLIAFNDNNSITGPPAPPGARIDWTPLSSQPITYYLKVFSAVASVNTGAGSYSIEIARGRSDANPTPIFTPNFTPTPTATTPSTPTVTPTPNTCRDIYEDDGDPSRAKFLKPSYTATDPFNGTPGVPVTGTANTGAQNHYICPKGDVDWVYMDLVKGKAYTIYTSNLTNGIDTYMALYQVQPDGTVAPIFANDDYPGMGLASRIDWVVPETPGTPLGEFVRYYLAVKDVASNGESLLGYTLILASPGDALGQCFDAYETNGKPQDAKEILLNEVQTHTFCPQNDTDWVKFFGKQNRRYAVSTLFFTQNAVGLDTKMSLWRVRFDTDPPTPESTIVQQTLIAESDDKSDTDLSSAVSFVLPEDGYYYVQINNAGNIGRNDLYYRINFAVGTGAPTNTVPPATIAPTSVTGTTVTATLDPVAATATARISNTLTALAATQTALVSATTSTGTNTVANISGLPFADAAFQKIWDYTDLAVFQNKVPRTWLWGKPGPVKLEIYTEAFDSQRQVQYFDKSRMEINNAKADRNSKWFVSNGLLVKELITGKIATGNNQFADLPPSDLPVAGDLSANNPAPKYNSFMGLISVNGSNQATNKVGQFVSEQISGAGLVTTNPKAPQTVKYSNFIKETGHNVPDVFWQYLNAKGMIFDGRNFVPGEVMDWVYVMGLPVTEAYWTKAIVAGVERDVLVQVFERRVLTYTPANPSNWQVEMANVGQHYYLWRYGN
jgi:hypothetical protein